ncbi:MAG: QueT transporter family protein [Clostridiaceae bacterium]|nr:QueT transporter family protein [Clostridiaceae bacterium]
MNKSNLPRHGRALYLTTAATIAALYVVLTLPFAQFAFGPIQFRLAECLVILPILLPAAIPGITIGCFLANLLNPGNLGPIDIVFGSLATLVAALLTYRLAKMAPFKKLIINDIVALVPPIIVNAIIVGTYLTFLLTEGAIRVTMIIVNVVYVGLSEMAVVYFIGLPLLVVLRKAGLRSTKE